MCFGRCLLPLCCHLSFEVDFVTRKKGAEAEVTQQVLSCYCRMEPALCNVMDKRVWHRQWGELLLQPLP